MGALAEVTVHRGTHYGSWSLRSESDRHESRRAPLEAAEHQFLEDHTLPENDRPKNVARNFGVKRPDYPSDACSLGLSWSTWAVSVSAWPPPPRRPNGRYNRNKLKAHSGSLRMSDPCCGCEHLKADDDEIPTRTATCNQTVISLITHSRCERRW